MFNENKKNKKTEQDNTLAPVQVPETTEQSASLQIAPADLLPQHLQDDDTVEAIFQSMKNLRQTNQATEVTGSYLELSSFGEGEERFFIFTGMEDMQTVDQQTGEMKTVRAVKLLAEDRTNYVCAAKVVVSSLDKVDKMPCAISIVVNGKTKGKNGSYYNARVFVMK